jgi:CRISPR-associated endonuclease/helicase Cas3
MGGDPECPKAKTIAAKNPRDLAGFRHELRSLVKAAETTSCDPVLHLVGSHHGWGRPHFEFRAYDPDDPPGSETEALKAAHRFGALQSRLGHWGLAYLEAVFKAADGLASSEDEK